VRGKPKTQFREAIDPDWVVVRKTCLELFEKSRDLRVAVTLTQALLYTDGLQGLSEGLAVIQGLLEKHWAAVYPKLDPDDNNDPLQRMNTLSMIATPRETLDDPPRSVTPLGEIALAQSRQFGRYTFEAIVEGRSGLFAKRKAAGETKPTTTEDTPEIKAAFQDTPQEKLIESQRSAGEALVHLRAIDAFLRAADLRQAPDLSLLDRELVTTQSVLIGYIRTAAPPEEEKITPDAPGPVKPQAIAGTISNRADVLRVLAQIRSFYADHEPASPIPLFIRRIERLVPMSFMEILGDIAPESITHVNTIVGPQQ
jgi:type VI secretion system protein ImpA